MRPATTAENLDALASDRYERETLAEMWELQSRAVYATNYTKNDGHGLWLSGEYETIPPAIVQQLTEGTADASRSRHEGADYTLGTFSARARAAVQEDCIVVHDSAHAHIVALLDGHGGRTVLDAAAALLPTVLGRFLDDLSPAQRAHAGYVRHAINSAFAGTHGPFPSVAQLLASKPQDGSGATALVAVLIDQSVYIAQLGRSVAYARVGGVLRRVTVDHSPALEAEAIIQRGGFVARAPGENSLRLNAILSTSRSLGHLDLPVGRTPDVVRLQGDAEQIVLMGRSVARNVGFLQVLQLTKQPADEPQDPELIAQHLVSFAYLAGAERNLSVAVLQSRH